METVHIFYSRALQVTKLSSENNGDTMSMDNAFVPNITSDLLRFDFKSVSREQDNCSDSFSLCYNGQRVILHSLLLS